MSKKDVEVEVTEPTNEVVIPDISGLTKEKAWNALMLAGIEYKEITKIWKEQGATSIRGGVFQAGLDYLAVEPRTQTELAQYILDFGTDNEARWFGQRDAIRKLTIAVRELPEGWEDVAITETQKTELKERYTKAEKVDA